MEKRWRFIISGIKCWARLLDNGITLFLLSKKGSEESKLRVTFRRLDDYIFFVNQLITIGNEAKLKLDKDGQEKTLLELEKVLEKK